MTTKTKRLGRITAGLFALGTGFLFTAHAAEPAAVPPAAEAVETDGACGCDEDEPEPVAVAPKPESKTAVTVSVKTKTVVDGGKTTSSVEESSHARYKNGVLVESGTTRIER